MLDDDLTRAAYPIAQDVAGQPPQPGAKTPLLPIQLEPRELLDEAGQDLLDQVGGVVPLRPLGLDVGQQQRLVERHELLPAVGIGQVADPEQQRTPCLYHGASSPSG